LASDTPILRTGRETFVLIRLKPFERLFGGDAASIQKDLAVNLVMALWMSRTRFSALFDPPCTRGTRWCKRHPVEGRASVMGPGYSVLTDRVISAEQGKPVSLPARGRPSKDESDGAAGNGNGSK
jgi:hypothetical protein